MAMLESSVVVYLRALYYPEGFTVALKMIDEKIIVTELLREAATIIMLIGIAVISGRTFIQRFSYFLFSFAVWDIFYYVWLKLLLNWPESFFTWDILFLIPVTWLGPVLAPLICSVTMIFFALILLNMENRDKKFKIKKFDWTLLLAGSVFIFYTFIQDYAEIIILNGWLPELHTIMQNEEFIKITSHFIPKQYNWSLFLSGEFILLFSILFIWFRNYSFKTRLYKYG